MTKAELVDKIQIKADLPSKVKAEDALEAVLNVLKETLASGDSITFTGFGTFKVADRPERMCRNPKTGDPIKVDACKVVKFTPGKALKDAIQ